MSKRKPIGGNVQSEVLVHSRRRCCLCAYLHGDFREKQGQIAHLDRNSASADLDNLVFLCLNHHDRYDSSTRQSKGLITEEVIRYRAKLYEWSSDLDGADRSTVSGERLNHLDIPWAFEIYYPRLKLLFRVSPRIYDLLPHHNPTAAEINQAIEDPVHVLKDCYHLLEAEQTQYDWEDNETYLHRCALPLRCSACKKPVLNAPPFRALHDTKLISGTRARFQLLSFKFGVFKDVRRLISLEVPLANRIPIKDWSHSLMVTFSA